MKEKGLILVPTDFTSIGDSAVEYAKQLAKILKANISLLHVVAKEKDTATAKNALENIASKLEADGIKANTIVAVGNIFDDIGKVAEDIKAALIVMGTHGVSGMQHVLGSKALKVITNSNVPYIVVQKKPMPKDGFKKILIPLDFNQEVKQSVKYAWEIGQYFKAKIYIAYVKEKDEFIAQKIERNIPYVVDLLNENNIEHEIIGLDKKDFTQNLLKYANSNELDLITIINNHENIFTYFGGSFEQKVIGNDFEIPVLVINAIHLKSAYSFSIYFG
ncbi:MAG: universal stress protein [Bacteroidia bacterium]